MRVDMYIRWTIHASEVEIVQCLMLKHHPAQGLVTNKPLLVSLYEN